MPVIDRTNFLDPRPIAVPGCDPLADALARAVEHYACRTHLTFDQALYLLTVGRIACVVGSVPLTLVARATH
jgi:hypothetical protein